jgi:trk system potassium uptake protein TrkH
VYLGFTVLEAGLLYGLHLAGLAPNMDLYNAVAHALTTLPTGGFSPEARSVEAFSAAAQWLIVLFMVVAGTNFALFWHVSKGRPERLVNNAEFRSYLLAMAGVSVLLAGLLFAGPGMAQVPENIAPLTGNLENSVRQAVFQTAAVVTTTGYASMDFNTWDESTQVVLLFAMFLGGSAGSAAGSIKIVRWYLVRKTIARELFTTVHPEAVKPIRQDGTAADDDTIRSIFVFIVLFLALFAASTVVIYVDSIRVGLDLTALEATSAAIATLGNVGPGWASSAR